MDVRPSLPLVVLLVAGCASAGPGNGATSVRVYLVQADVPCDYEVVEPVSGFVSVTSVQQYVRERDRLLSRQGARVGADAVLIPTTQREPDRDDVGLQFRRVGGVTQASEVRVAGDAIRFATSCAARR